MVSAIRSSLVALFTIMSLMRRSICFAFTSYRRTAQRAGAIYRTPQTLSSHCLYYSSTIAVNGDDQSLSSSFETTPLGSNGKAQLKGLDVYEVPSAADGHSLAVYGIQSSSPSSLRSTERHPILLLHGRTWSSVPVYHLESRSLMEALLARNLQPYCMDFRGFGGTHADTSGFVEPAQCVADTESVLQWILQRHGEKPSLLGWSQGALVAQLTCQKSPQLAKRLVLYGSIYDPTVRFPREPLYATIKNHSVTDNTFDDAIEDFTIEGSIPHETATQFAKAALESDPVKAVWKHLYQFNNCDPGRVHIPTLIVAGDQDPYAPLHVQQDLFVNLGRGSDRTWSILSNCDHAVHLLKGRHRFISTVVSFCRNGKRSENEQHPSEED